jgi:succinate dehydrogenase / fumarate reductase cytochrome b subunit
MASTNRPLSPHLQVYRLPLTGIISITHRATGVFLTMGTLLLVCWLMSAAAGAESFASIQAFMSSGFGMLILFGWTFALFFHLCHGVRHLIWDAGRSFEKETMDQYAMVEIGIAAVLTFFLWALA